MLCGYIYNIESSFTNIGVFFLVLSGIMSALLRVSNRIAGSSIRITNCFTKRYYTKKKAIQNLHNYQIPFDYRVYLSKNDLKDGEMVIKAIIKLKREFLKDENVKLIHKVVLSTTLPLTFSNDSNKKKDKERVEILEKYKSTMLPFDEKVITNELKELAQIISTKESEASKEKLQVLYMFIQNFKRSNYVLTTEAHRENVFQNQVFLIFWRYSTLIH